MFPEGRALEFLLAAVIALVVVGPKDLPVLMRKLGQFIGRMRAMAAEFRASFDEMARQSELDDLRKEVEAMRRGQFADVAAHAGEADVHDAFTDIQQGLSGAASDLHGAMGPVGHDVHDFHAPAPDVEPAPAKPAPKPRAKPRPKTADPISSAEAVAKKTPARSRAKTKPEPEA